MEEPKPLDSLFKEKIFRIPDYQRGYAWQKTQLKDFWEDLINLGKERSLYTGVLTLKELTKYDEILRELAFERMVVTGLIDARNERVMSNEDMEHRIKSWQNGLHP